MQDKHTGDAGTFYSDPKTGERLTEKEWLARQSADKSAAPVKPKIGAVKNG